MEPLKGSTDFCYNEGEEHFAAIDIYIHHACNIHNICIYDDQDVYAKFSFTCSPEDTASTRIVHRGGKNPCFDEVLRLKLARAPCEAVLKCEIWVPSRAPCYIEDQLLGFALVPLSLVVSAENNKLTDDFTLSSTDLFHSPAGKVKLTLSLDASVDEKTFAAPTPSSSSSISSEVVLLDLAEYGRIEFPDINATYENQFMAKEYLDMAAPRTTATTTFPFLYFGASSNFINDCDMSCTNNLICDDNHSSASPSESHQNSGMLRSTATSASDDRNSAESSEKISKSIRNHFEATSFPSSSKVLGENSKIDSPQILSSKQEMKGGGKENNGDFNSVFKSPMASLNLEAEQNAIQQQIVDMYMRSMQQFSESLAKMKLPMDLDSGRNATEGQSNNELESKNKKDGSRVFYGSRAFF